MKSVFKAHKTHFILLLKAQLIKPLLKWKPHQFVGNLALQIVGFIFNSDQIKREFFRPNFQRFAIETNRFVSANIVIVSG